MLRFFGLADRLHTIRILPVNLPGWKVGLMLPKSLGKPQGWDAKKPSAAQVKDLKTKFGDDLSGFNMAAIYWLGDPAKGGNLDKVKIPAAGTRVLLTAITPGIPKPLER